MYRRTLIFILRLHQPPISALFPCAWLVRSIAASCLADPTPPRDSLVDTVIDGPHRAVAGDNYWRLISFLQLSHFGLVDRSDGTGAAALREILSIFADLSDSVTEAQIGGIRSVETRPITRTIRRAGAYHPARGLEVVITIDEDEYEGSHIMVMGAILDRFLADFAAVNAFTQTVIHSRTRGHVKTFPPRSGSGPLI